MTLQLNDLPDDPQEPVLPDLVDGLSEAQLRDLMDMVAGKLTQLQGQQQSTRQQLLDTAVVRGEIEDLQGQVADLHSVIETLTAPAPQQDGGDAREPDPLVVIARASCRIASNTIRLLRTAAGVLDSADLGEEG